MSWNVGWVRVRGLQRLCWQVPFGHRPERERGSRLFSLRMKAFEPRQIPMLTGQQGSQMAKVEGRGYFGRKRSRNGNVWQLGVCENPWIFWLAF